MGAPQDFYDDGLLTNHSIIQKEKSFFKEEASKKDARKKEDVIFTKVPHVYICHDLTRDIFPRLILEGSTIYILSIIPTNMFGR